MAVINHKIIIHIIIITTTHDMGDKWGINVHPGVTLTWQVSDIY